LFPPTFTTTFKTQRDLADEEVEKVGNLFWGNPSNLVHSSDVHERELWSHSLPTYLRTPIQTMPKEWERKMIEYVPECHFGNQREPIEKHKRCTIIS